MDYALILTLNDSTTVSYTYADINGTTLYIDKMPDNVTSILVGSGITSISYSRDYATANKKNYFVGYTFDDGVDISINIGAYYFTPLINSDIEITEPRIKKVSSPDYYNLLPTETESIYVGEYACSVEINAFHTSGSTPYPSLKEIEVIGNGECKVIISTGVSNVKPATLTSVTMGNGVRVLGIAGTITPSILDLSTSVKQISGAGVVYDDLTAPGLTICEWSYPGNKPGPTSYPSNSKIIYGRHSMGITNSTVTYPNKCIWLNEKRYNITGAKFPSSLQSLVREDYATRGWIGDIYIGNKCTNISDYCFDGFIKAKNVYFSCEQADESFKRNSYCGEQNIGGTGHTSSLPDGYIHTVENYVVKGYTTAKISGGSYRYIKNCNVVGNGNSTVYLYDVGFWERDDDRDKWIKGTIKVGDGVKTLYWEKGRNWSAPNTFPNSMTIGKDIEEIYLKYAGASSTTVQAATPPTVYRYDWSTDRYSIIYPDGWQVPSQYVSVYEAAGWTNVTGV